jgi:hypothetical protein
MATIPQVSEAVQSVLVTTAAQVDAELHYTKRPDSAKLTGSLLTQALVLGWLAHPDATVEQLAQSAARVGVAVSPQAIDQRFSFATATLLQTILSRSLQHLIAADPVAIPILQRFSAVRVHDSTTINLPDALASVASGCGGRLPDGLRAALKCGLQLDLLTGALCGLELTDGRAADQRLSLQQAPMPAGGLRLADLGFYDLELLARLDAAGVYWISKVYSVTRVSTDEQPEQSLLSFVQGLGAFEEWEGEVWVGQARQVRARLLLQRVPQEVADQRRRRLRKEARDHGRQPSAAALALAAWSVLITNAPPGLLSLKEVLVLAKVRWQIELVFKLWKSHGLVDEWRSDKPARILCEVYGKLLGLVLQHWLLVLSCWDYPERSLVKAAQVVRDHAIILACAQGASEALCAALATIQRVLKTTARMNTRRKKPNTYQLLLALTTQEAAAGLS